MLTEQERLGVAYKDWIGHDWDLYVNVTFGVWEHGNHTRAGAKYYYDYDRGRRVIPQKGAMLFLVETPQGSPAIFI